MPSDDKISVGVNQALLIGMLSIAVMLVNISVSLYIPTMPEMVLDFQRSPSELQLTLSIFVIGFGVSQLMWGPLTDRYGRKSMMTLGFILYILASFGAWFSAHLEMLITFRFFQAIGASSIPVIALAIVRDIYARHEMARVMSYINAFRVVAPIIAPSLGALIAIQFGWRGNFAFMTLFGIGLLALLWMTLPETHPQSHRQAISIQQIRTNYKTLFSNARHLGYAFCGGFSFANFFIFISTSSFIFIDLIKLSPGVYALTFAVVVAGFGIGALVSARVVKKLSLDGTVLTGITLSVIGAILLNLLPILFGLDLIAIAIPMMIVSTGVGLAFSNCQTGALSEFPKMAGYAAATSGFIVMTVSGILGALAMRFYDGTASSLTGGIAASTIAMTGVYYFLVWRRRPVVDQH